MSDVEVSFAQFSIGVDVSASNSIVDVASPIDSVWANTHNKSRLTVNAGRYGHGGELTAGDIALAGPSALSSGHQGYDMLVCDDGVGLLEDEPLYAHKGPTPFFQQWGVACLGQNQKSLLSTPDSRASQEQADKADSQTRSGYAVLLGENANALKEGKVAQVGNDKEEQDAYVKIRVASWVLRSRIVVLSRTVICKTQALKESGVSTLSTGQVASWRVKELKLQRTYSVICLSSDAVPSSEASAIAEALFLAKHSSVPVTSATFNG
ncbi:hypothetical protein SCLCIDRAFT_8228 [Scleroderma citrinum Foug A]|uniref:Uncharacterized protein n=1 Tax=Scleroderma citrinum Foug A TaxID=1036808 RepID=A0A0C3EA47_9AGAM|nr:hypothetical protein SCLCIDRAFT_8228 [Scleroderma citrinum Foug A]